MPCSMAALVLFWPSTAQHGELNMPQTLPAVIMWRARDTLFGLAIVLKLQ